MKMKAYILLPFFIAACGGTIDAPTDSGKTPDAPIIQTDAGQDADAKSDACLPAEQVCVEARCQFSSDPADSIGCNQGQGFTWRQGDASTGVSCNWLCDVGATCWDNADPTHMGHCVQVSP